MWEFYHGYKTVFEKCYCCDGLVFMSLTVFQGVQAQQTGFDYQRQQRIVECVTLLMKS